MYDTARRVELVKRQIRKNTRRRQKRGIGRLSAVCMLLFAALMQTADRVVGQGQTVVCMRLHEREKQKRKHEEDAT